MCHLVPLVPNCNLNILERMPTGKSLIDRTFLSAQGSTEEPGAFLAEDFLPMETGYLLGRSIPGYYPPILVQSHDPFGDTVENSLEQLIVSHFLLPFLLEKADALMSRNVDDNGTRRLKLLTLTTEPNAFGAGNEE